MENHPNKNGFRIKNGFGIPYHHLPVVKGVSSNPSINQPTNGRRTSMGQTAKKNHPKSHGLS
jgi:hypothetical protein